MSIKIKNAIKEHYENLAKEKQCVCGNAEDITASLGYRVEDLKDIPEEADMGLGCGNPQILSKPRRGETVLDLGCGRGIDCFIAAKALGGTGRVFGIDESETMIKKASEIALKNGFDTCKFIHAEIENIPLPDNFVNLVISNCVINLSQDKERVYSQIYRVLCSGGRIGISDITLKQELPELWLSDPAMIKT